MPDFILFDLDGTLTDPSEGITNSVRHALEKRGIHVSDRTALYPFIGPPLMDSFMKFYGFTRAEATRAITDYREYFTDRGIFENRVYPGIPQLLATLRQTGKTLCMATSKPEPFARRIADRFELTPYFQLIAGSCMDETRTRKSEVLSYVLEQLGGVIPSRAIMVGDRSYDVIGAHEVGLSCIGVTYGYGSAEELTAVGADALASTPEELRRLLGNG